MRFAELFIIAVGLSMDAFAVSLCKGMASCGKTNVKGALLAGLYFGGFQALMPLIGYFVGAQFYEKIAFIDHWFIFVLLSVVGIRMIMEAREKDEVNGAFDFKTMLVLAVATSIDALAVGVSFALMPEIKILPAVSLIGVVTFVFSFAGVAAGCSIGEKGGSRAKILGGIILVLIAIKILVEHLFF